MVYWILKTCFFYLHLSDQLQIHCSLRYVISKLEVLRSHTHNKHTIYEEINYNLLLIKYLLTMLICVCYHDVHSKIRKIVSSLQISQCEFKFSSNGTFLISNTRPAIDMNVMSWFLHQMFRCLVIWVGVLATGNVRFCPRGFSTMQNHDKKHLFWYVVYTRPKSFLIINQQNILIMFSIDL